MWASFSATAREFFSGWSAVGAEVLEEQAYGLYFMIRVMFWNPETALVIVKRLWASVGTVLANGKAIPLGGLYYLLACITTPGIFVIILSPAAVVAGISFLRAWLRIEEEREVRGIKNSAIYTWLLKTRRAL